MSNRSKHGNTKDKAKLKAIKDALIFDKNTSWKTSQVSEDRLLAKVDNAFKNTLIDGQTYNHYLCLIFHTDEYP
uniref:Uncharacterized protein n=1 Tax=Pithovirus LCPAC401 TaxID=2506595 RepID=A0A481ZCT0_9VIRU|nr:MAG: hypothetical protein LCPAC401_01090 [Pithovirus LCPAC401]